MTNKMPTVAMLLIMMLGILTALLPGFVVVPAQAEASRPVDDGWTFAGQPVFLSSTDWMINEDDDLYFENTVFDFDVYSMFTLGGSIKFQNCTFWFTGTAHGSDGLRLYEGNFTALNCSFYSEAKVNDTLTEYSWEMQVLENAPDKAAVNVTMFDCWLNSSINPNFANPAADSNMILNRGNDTFYYCTIQMPEMLFDSGNNSGNISFINSEVIGNRTVWPDTTVSFVAVNSINIHGVDTALINDGSADEIELVVEDAGGNVVPCVNESLPAGLHLDADYMYAPDLGCHWFAVLNASQDDITITNTSHREYPFTAIIDRPAGWTVGNLITLVDYAPYDAATDKYGDGYNASNPGFAVGETEEDNYSASENTDDIVVVSSSFSFPLRAPIEGDFGEDWILPENYLIYSDFGGQSLDYVTLVADAGTYADALVGATIDLDGTASVGENVLSNFTWTITNSSGDVVDTEYGAAPDFETDALEAGIYTITLLVKDDEGALDGDFAFMNLAEPTDGGSTPADDDEAGFDWSENWFEFWTKSFWVDGIWGALKNFHSWVRDDLLWSPPNWVLFVIYALLALFALEMWTEVKFYSWIKSGFKAVMGAGKRGSRRTPARKGGRKGGRRSN